MAVIPYPPVPRGFEEEDDVMNWSWVRYPCRQVCLVVVALMLGVLPGIANAQDFRGGVVGKAELL